MRLVKIMISIFLYIWTSNLHANFTLSQVHSTMSMEPKITREVVNLNEAPPPIDMEESNEPQEFNYWQEFFRMMLILGLILGAVLILAWFLKGYLNKRIKHVNQQNRIKVLERRNLSQKSMLYLIEVGGKQMVIADSAAGGVQFLMNFSEAESESLPQEAVKTKNLASRFSFTQILQRKLSDKSLKPFLTPKNIKSDYEIHEEN